MGLTGFTPRFTTGLSGFLGGHHIRLPVEFRNRCQNAFQDGFHSGFHSSFPYGFHSRFLLWSHSGFHSFVGICCVHVCVSFGYCGPSQLTFHMVAIVPTRQDFRRVCLALYCVLSAFLLRTYYGLLALAFWGKRQPFSRGTIGLRWASHYPAGVCSLSHVHCARLTLAKFCCGALSRFAPLEAFAAMRTTPLTTPPWSPWWHGACCS